MHFFSRLNSEVDTSEAYMEEGGTDVRAFLAFFRFWTTSDIFSLSPIRKKEFLKAFNALSLAT